MYKESLNCRITSQKNSETKEPNNTVNVLTDASNGLPFTKIIALTSEYKESIKKVTHLQNTELLYETVALLTSNKVEGSLEMQEVSNKEMVEKLLNDGSEVEKLKKELEMYEAVLPYFDYIVDVAHHEIQRLCPEGLAPHTHYLKVRNKVAGLHNTCQLYRALCEEGIACDDVFFLHEETEKEALAVSQEFFHEYVKGDEMKLLLLEAIGYFHEGRIREGYKILLHVEQTIITLFLTTPEYFSELEEFAFITNILTDIQMMIVRPFRQKEIDNVAITKLFSYRKKPKKKNSKKMDSLDQPVEEALPKFLETLRGKALVAMHKYMHKPVDQKQSLRTHVGHDYRMEKGDDDSILHEYLHIFTSILRKLEHQLPKTQFENFLKKNASVKYFEDIDVDKAVEVTLEEFSIALRVMQQMHNDINDGKLAAPQKWNPKYGPTTRYSKL